MRHTYFPGDAGYIDDAAIFTEKRKRCTGQQHWRDEVDVQDSGQLLCSPLEHCAAVVAPCIVDDEIESAKVSDDPLWQLEDGGSVTHIERKGTDPLITQLSDCTRQQVNTPRDQRHPDSALGQAPDSIRPIPEDAPVTIATQSAQSMAHGGPSTPIEMWNRAR